MQPPYNKRHHIQHKNTVIIKTTHISYNKYIPHIQFNPKKPLDGAANTGIILLEKKKGKFCSACTIAFNIWPTNVFYKQTP